MQSPDCYRIYYIIINQGHRGFNHYKVKMGRQIGQEYPINMGLQQGQLPTRQNRPDKFGIIDL
jgi:hypothetical protein